MIKEINAYTNELLILKVKLDGEVKPLPYRFTINTNLVFTEKDFSLLCKKLERGKHNHFSKVMEKARKEITIKNKKLNNKRQYFEIILDDTIFSKKRYSYGVKRKIRVNDLEFSKEETNIYCNEKVLYVKGSYGVFDFAARKDLEDKSPIPFKEIKLEEAINKISRRLFKGINDLAQTLFLELGDPAFRELYISSYDKYKERRKYTFSLLTKKIIKKEIFCEVKKSNYTISIKYVPRKRELTKYMLGRASKNNIVDTIKKLSPKSYEIKIKGESYPIKVEAVSLKK